ncbi:MAG: signal peptidase I [Verrucomicrobiota bacterium]
MSSPLWMRMVFGRSPKRTLLRLSCLVLTTFVLFRFVLIPIRVSGFSMMPTYRDGRVNLVNHQAYRWKKPHRGDVIAFRLPEEGNVVLLKRIVAVPGERVRVVQGRAIVNGEPLDEPYIKLTPNKSAPTMGRDLLLGADEYFVIGDNRNVSITRKIPKHYILGKVLF